MQSEITEAVHTVECQAKSDLHNVGMQGDERFAESGIQSVKSDLQAVHPVGEERFLFVSLNVTARCAQCGRKERIGF